MSVSAQQVVWCFKLLLGREPESDAVIREHQSMRNLFELLLVLYRSDEYRRRDLRPRWLRNLSDLLRSGGHPDAYRRLALCEVAAHGVQAHSAHPEEIYRGYVAEDAARLAALVVQPAVPAEGFYVDCFGQRFHPAHQPAISNRLGLASSALPLPGDGHLSDGIEYVAGALAFAAARGRDRFSAVELGAGWGPWTTFFGLSAQALGFKRIQLAAFEADAKRFAQLREHLAQNQLVAADAAAEGDDGKLSWQLLNAAAWWKNETLLWPDHDNPLDAGMRAESLDHEQQRGDYRGHKSGFRAIPAFDIVERLREVTPIDIIHIDIQGSEAELVPQVMDFLNTQVRSMFIGTHSRKIEGDLMELLYQQGWQLLREKPCRFDQNSNAPTLDGRTVADGGQYWKNPRLQ